MERIWEAAALIALLGSFVATTALARAILPRLLMPFAAALGMAGLVCYEAILLNLLSVASAVTRPLVIIGHIALIAMGAVFGRPRSVLKSLHPRASWVSAALVPLFLIVTISALRYPPNSTDSMTYHLSRIAYWMKFRSVDPFPTYVSRQIATPPGAEYVVALPQLIGNTDRWAALVQLLAYVILVACSAPLARLAGAPKWIARLGSVIVASIPVVVLNASSTGNDIVAATLSIPVVVLAVHAARPRHGVVRRGATAAFGVAISAVLLTKPTGAVVVAPVVAVLAIAAGVRLIRTWSLAQWRPALASLAAGAAPLVILVPEALHRNEIGQIATDLQRGVVFDWTEPLLSRLANAWRGLLYHLGFFGSPLDLFASRHESSTPAEIAVLLTMACCVVAMYRTRRLSPRARVAVVCVIVAWALFGVTFRHVHVATGRIQTPLIALGTVASLAAFHRASSRGLAWAMPVAAAVALVIGYHAAITHQPRPPFARFAGPREALYYADDPVQRRAQELALEIAAETSCRRIGLLAEGSNTFDYPLVWRGRALGIDVRQVSPDDPWACMFFSTGFLPQPREGEWQAFDFPVTVWNGTPITMIRPVVFARIR